MRRRLSIITLALLALGAPLTADPATRLEPVEMRPVQYFPLIVKSPIPVEVVETARAAIDGYPSHYFVYGDVRNLTSTPLYSVTLELEVTMYPYNPEGDPQPYVERVPLTTALPATLPGQINPFSYDLLLGKASAELGALRVVSANSSAVGGALYYPLTAVNVTRDGANLRGTVRNDSTQPLNGVLVAVTELQNAKCAWKRPSLSTTTLHPGQTVTFQIDDFYLYCPGEPVAVLGQGNTAER
jgi:hypothetical protein